MCLELSSYSIFVQVQVFWTRCLEPSSPSVGRKFSFPSSAATASPLIRQEFGKRQEGAQRQKGEVSVEGTEEGNGCWMPDPAQFVQKRIKVEGVGIKMVQDLTMDDFRRWIRLSLTSQICVQELRMLSSVTLTCQRTNFHGLKFSIVKMSNLSQGFTSLVQLLYCIFVFCWSFGCL